MFFGGNFGISSVLESSWLCIMGITPSGAKETIKSLGDLTQVSCMYAKCLTNCIICSAP